METFQKVKPICVSLMGMASERPTPYTQHHHLIASLHTVIASVPPSTLDPAVINYILFPLTTVIRQSNPAILPDCFLEASLGLLAFIVKAWRLCDEGMDLIAWEQLWKFGVAAVGPRVGAGVKPEDKGKGKEVGQEVQLQAVTLLEALLNPSEPGATLAHPTPAMLERVATPKSPLLPTLFQTITMLLETASPSPPHLQLQVASIKLLRSLLSVYLAGKHQVLAAVLPGTVSAMVKLVTGEGKSLKGEVAGQSVGVIEDVVNLTLNDDDLRTLGVLRPVADNLSQLADEWEASEAPTPSEEPALSPTSAAGARPDPFPPLSTSYLSFTSSQLLSTLPPTLFTVAAHPSDLARHAAASLASTLIAKCSESLPQLRSRALSALLLLSQDTFDPIRHDARRKLRALFSDETLLLSSTLVDILSDAVNSLPRMVTSQQDSKVLELSQLVTAVAEASTELSRHQGAGKNVIAELLGPSGNVERWSWALMACLEFGKPVGWTAEAGTAERLARLGWEGRLGSGAASGLLLENGVVEGEDRQGLERFPHLPLRYVESESTVRALGAMLSALGAAGGEAALHSVEYFVLFAKANTGKQVPKAVSALWVAEKLLDGVMTAQVEGLEGRVSRATRKMAREVVKAVVAMDDAEEGEDEDEEVSYGKEEESEALVPVERGKGFDVITTLLDRKPLPNSHSAAETRRLHLEAQRTLLTALSLESLSVSAHILSSSFRPLLLSSLYIVLSHLASPQPIIHSYASLALSHIAEYTGYASPSALVLDNVDYVINVVTQRLTYKHLSATAPIVLIAMIRLVGEPIVPLVHDVVDEIFDALDDYHGYETMASSLLAVLVTLIEVMSKEVEAEGPSEERLKKVEEMRRVGKAPEPKEDLEQLFGWWEKRREQQKEEIESILERAPQHAWGAGDVPGSEDAGEKEDEDVKMEDEAENQPTRSQAVATRILSKSLFFLTHRSPFLRSKVLSLVANAIPVLALGNRESDLLPLINDAWSSILNRLDDPEVYVVVEAAEVIAALCEHVGDFMSKRVLDHAWPRLLKLLDAQRELDRRSALARRGGAVGTESAHTVSHRLHVAILKTAVFIAREVPVADSVLWEMGLVFRPFLDQRVHEELQKRAVGVYAELGKRDGDAVWVVLQGTIGKSVLDEGVWGYLRDGDLDIEGNARSILEDL
ncbi:hypothetical protein IAT38_000218 [Cryptococcus sp. DSM 104549]